VENLVDASWLSIIHNTIAAFPTNIIEKWKEKDHNDFEQHYFPLAALVDSDLSNCPVWILSNYGPCDGPCVDKLSSSCTKIAYKFDFSG
jgi:hypothetical protein